MHVVPHNLIHFTWVSWPSSLHGCGAIKPVASRSETLASTNPVKLSPYGNSNNLELLLSHHIRIAYDTCVTILA
jgi:hypothetical protein